IITLGISILIVFHLKKKNRGLEEINTDTITTNPDIINNKTREQIMGEQFVDYTKSLFDDSDWKLLRAGPDRSQKEGRNVRDDSDPDLEVQYRKNYREIAVECKYLSFYSEWYHGSERKLRINNKNIKNYKAYHLRTGIKTYILFGVGGKPSEPKDMYLIPLNQIVPNNYPNRYLREGWFSEYKIENRGFKIEDFIVE
ncbi:MAG: hypothetical protein KAT05_02470, partial [Spirochaetes bacterium]|nr:hypothetical protein [Spirochaetota bacterium]